MVLCETRPRATIFLEKFADKEGIGETRQLWKSLVSSLFKVKGSFNDRIVVDDEIYST